MGSLPFCEVTGRLPRSRLDAMTARTARAPGPARKPQPAAKRRDRVRTGAQPHPGARKARSQASERGGPGNGLATRQRPERRA